MPARLPLLTLLCLSILSAFSPSPGLAQTAENELQLLPKSANLLAFYPHQEGSGSTLKDASGHANDAHPCAAPGFTPPRPTPDHAGWAFGKHSCFEYPAALSISGAQTFAAYTCMTPALLQTTAGTPNDAWNASIFPTLFGSNGDSHGLELGFFTSMSAAGYPMKGFSYPFDIAIFDAGLGRGSPPQGLYSTLGLETITGCSTAIWVLSPSGDQVSLNGVPPALFSGGGKPGATNADHQAGLLWSEGASQRPQTRGINWWPGPVYLSAVWNTALNSSEQKQVAQAFAAIVAKRSIQPPPAHLETSSPKPFGNLLVVGESIMQGTYGQPFNRQPDFAPSTTLAYPQFNNNNIGTGCWNEEAFLAEPNRADAFLDPAARRNVLVVSPNVNSHNSCIRAFGLTKIDNPKTAVELLKKYVAQRRQAGWTVLVMPAFKAIDDWSDAWNTLVGDTWPQWSDGFISVILDPALGADNAANVQKSTVAAFANYTDGAHPGPTYPAMALYVAQYLNLLDGCRDKDLFRAHPPPLLLHGVSGRRIPRRRFHLRLPHPHPPRLHPLPGSPPHHRKPRLRQHRHPPGQHRHLRQHRSRHLLQRLGQHQLLRIPALHPDHQGFECHRPAPVRGLQGHRRRTHAPGQLLRLRWLRIPPLTASPAAAVPGYVNRHRVIPAQNATLFSA